MMYDGEKRPEKTKLRPRMTKVYHKKSRNGCQECRSRRVKCDEKKPTCGHCERREISCVYPDRTQEQPKRQGALSRANAKQSTTPPDVFGAAGFASLVLTSASESQQSPSPYSNSTSNFSDDIHLNIDINSFNGLSGPSGINGLNGINEVDEINGMNGLNSLSSINHINHITSLDGMNRLNAPGGMSSGHRVNYMDVMNDISDNSFQLTESRSRRLLELRLLNFFKDKIANPLPHILGSEEVSAWSNMVPELALKHDNVQYMMFCTAAGRLLRYEPDNIELINARRVYLSLAIREQKAALANLNVDNCDAVSYTGMMLLITSLATLWRRPMNPYVPPTECLRLGYGVGAVLEAANSMLKDRKDAKMWLFINAPPVLRKEAILAPENELAFQQLLNPNIQPWNPDMHNAYNKAVAYLGYLHMSLQSNDPIHVFGRKLVSFSIFVPKEFFDFVEECRPRALVILAHYFAFMTRAKSLYWAEEIPEAEIPAIQEILPPEWQEHLRWPLMMIGHTTF